MAAREALFRLHAPYAQAVARRQHRQRNRGDIDSADVEQLAFEALIEAIERFDPDRGVPFRAFAARRIAGAIIDGIRHMTEVREQLSWKHRTQRDRMRSLSSSDVAELSIDQALAMLGELAAGLALGFMLEGTSLYVDEREDAAVAVRAKSATAYDSAAWKELTAQLTRELAGLDERERRIVELHYIQGVAFDHLASLLGVSKGRVSQLHRHALTTLRKRMATRGQFRLER